MEQGRFDAMSTTGAGGQSRRTALRRVIGGGLTAVLAAAGLGPAEDVAAARSRCRHRCAKKNSRAKRRQCLKRCRRDHTRDHTLIQVGTAELTRLSPENCSELGTCRDAVFGAIIGAPVIDGTFTGVMTGTNIRGDATSLTVDFSGTLVAGERIGHDTIGATLALTMIQQREPVDNAPFVFSGSFVIAGGTGRFAGATGHGTISGEGTRPFGGAEGTVDSFRMDGKYRLRTRQ